MRQTERRASFLLCVWIKKQNEFSVTELVALQVVALRAAIQLSDETLPCLLLLF